MKKDDKKSSASFYNKEVVSNRDCFFNSYVSSDSVTKDLILLAANKINSIPKAKMLDIGTGNGYVLKETIKLVDNKNQAELVGIDLSENMVERARIYCKENKQIKIINANNYNIPFRDSYFNVITNKLSTNFSIHEVFRVLKKGGIFIFKEYGLLKGMGEITNLFRDRVSVTDPLRYLKEIRNENPKKVSYNQLHVSKDYTEEEVVNILKIAPIIKDFNLEKDIKEINKLTKNGKISIVSDPFLIVVEK